MALYREADLNCRPSGYESDALTSWATPTFTPFFNVGGKNKAIFNSDKENLSLIGYQIEFHEKNTDFKNS